jgi:hypothetical protein
LSTWWGGSSSRDWIEFISSPMCWYSSAAFSKLLPVLGFALNTWLRTFESLLFLPFEQEKLS